MKKILCTTILILIMTLAHVAIAQIEYNLSDQKDYAKTVVGAIGGTVDVTALGGASYSIPIQVPEGINGMQPSLAVNYNSQSGNGLLGWGWNLSGTSAITRVGKTLYHDGQTKGVDFDDDRFSLDGQRLLLVNNRPYGGNGAEYRTEVDGMTKIVSYTCDTTNGPAYFKVWLPNGNIAYYGYKDNTRIALQQRHDVCMWMLDSIVDRNGNYVAYRYHKGLSSCRLEKIVYTGNSRVGLAPCFLVKFTYSNRIDNEMAFVGNNVLRQEKILIGIEVYNTTSTKSVLWEYDFHYDQDVSSGSWLYYNRLKSIDFYCDGKKYNPTTIDWEISSPNSSLTSIKVGDEWASNTSELSFVKFTGDFNGDGYTDVISSGNLDDSRLHLYLNNGRPNSNRVYFTDVASFERDSNLDWIYVGDFNGDGMDDFMCVIRDRSWLLFDFVTLKPYLTRKRYDGTFWFEECESPNNGDYWVGKRKELTLVMGDFLGNKKMSFIFQTHRNSKRKHKYIYFDGNDPNGHCFAQKNVEDLNAECMRAADFNGDGITEIWYYSADESDWYGKIVKLNNDYSFEHINDRVLSRKDRTYVGDFNGDGKADLLSYNQNEEIWKIHIWKQTNCHWQSQNITDIMPLGDPGNYGFSIFGFDWRYKAIEVADFNGDGKTDIAAVKEDGTINDRLVILYAPFTSDNCAFKEEYNIRSTDINVMAQKDICVGNFLGKESASLFSEHSLFSIAPITHRYSVSAITDGMGNSVSFEYKYLMPNTRQPSENDFYKNTHNQHALGGSGCFVVSLPMRGVERLKRRIANAPYVSDAIAYKYENAIIHNRGRGFLGFETVWIANGTNASGTVIRQSSLQKRHFNLNSMGSHYSLLMDYDSCYAIPIDQSEQILSSVVSYMYEKKVNANNNLVYMPLLVKRTTDQFDIYNNGQFLNRTISRSFYNNGRRDAEASNYQYTMHLFKTIEGTGLGHDDNEVNHADRGTIVEADYQHENYTDWIINRPYSTKTTSFSREDPTHPVTLMLTCDYEDQNPFMVTRQTVFPGGSIDMSDPLATYTDNVYDEVGNIVHSSSGDLLGQLPVTTVDNIYYPNYRQLQKQTNQAGYETCYTYDPVFGYCSSTTDCNGLVTSYSGDIMGVNTQTIYPNGIISHSYTDWVKWWDQLQPQHQQASYFELLQKTGEADTKIYYDATGRKLRVVNYGFNGETICVDTKYNSYGQVKSVSEPFYLTNLGNERYSVFEYDMFFRNNKTIAPDETSIETIVDGFTTTTIHHPKPGSNLPEQTTSTIVNAAGLTIESVDANGTSVHYAYYPDGKLRWTQIGEDETTRVSLEYDNAGNRTFLKDPDYGMVNSLFNAYGQLCLNTDPKGNTTEYHYDNLGRNIERIETDAVTGESEHTNWYYDINGNDQLDHIVGKHQTIQYEYDQLGRVLSVAEQRDTYWTGMTTSYEYDELSRVRRITYPTGYSIQKEYNELGYLAKIKNGSGLPLWETLKVNEFGQIVRFMLGENITNTRDFDDSHRLKQSISESGIGIIQSFSFDYDDFSNLANRKDDKRGMEESFLYDDLNRLTTITTNGVVSSMEYDDYGRIISKMADGQMVFNNAKYETFDEIGSLKPHAISEANMAINPFPGENQSITYTMFDKVRTITQDNRELTYDYGYDHQRIQMIETVDGTVVAEKDYFGNCEIVHKENTIPYTYISGPLGIFAVVKQVMGSDQISFIHKDHLGSWTTISDYDGNVEQELSFDAWGNLRDPETWSGEFTDTPMLDRGYTGHEHLYDFGLINMNGRMYDPIMSSFLSVDNYVQQPDNSQNFNRYAYCLNNPMKYVDPEGEDFVAAAIIIGGVVWGAYTGGALANEGNYNISEWDSGMKTAVGVVLGGVVGGLSSWGGMAIAEASFSFCNTVSLAASSFAYSVGMYGTGLVAGFDYDITMNFGACSVSFSPDDNNWSFGYPFKRGNSLMDNIGYGLGALTNACDIYHFATWGALNNQQRFNKLERWAKKHHNENNLIYDPKHTVNGKPVAGSYDWTSNKIYIADDGLNRSFGYAKSTYMHELNHRKDMQARLFDLWINRALRNMEEDVFGLKTAADEWHTQFFYESDVRSYAFELNNASRYGLTRWEYNQILGDYKAYSYYSGLSVHTKKYSLWTFFKSIILP